ncbi:hypothetical protein V1525DRAFT_422843 [Lipomyces kononenkoae]|uniref:Uncharacterized protein n=1 Tax=Lipomyces kononenkoae TaxID=34357 RepID=A0ACC3SQ56_LIPKO
MSPKEYDIPYGLDLTIIFITSTTYTNFKRRNASARLNTSTFYDECRLSGEYEQVNKKRRHTPMRDADQCNPVKMKVVRHCDGNGQIISYSITKTDGTHHTHDSDRSDQIKQNSRDITNLQLSALSNNPNERAANKFITVDQAITEVFLTDDSVVEQLAVKKAFPGLMPASRKCHICCAKRIRCELWSAELAIRAAPSEEIKNYTIREWRNTKSMGAMFARQHSPVLLQVSTTNPVEAFHRRIKFSVSSRTKKTKFGFLGLVSHLHMIGTKIDEDARRSEENFRSRHLKAVENFLELRSFPVPIQKLLIGELE